MADEEGPRSDRKKGEAYKRRECRRDQTEPADRSAASQGALGELKGFSSEDPSAGLDYLNSIHALEIKVTKLEGQVKENRKGIIGKAERAGILVGLAGTVLAIILGVISFPKACRELRSQPEVTRAAGWPLRISYDPQKRLMSFEFAVKLGNNGTANETIEEINGQIKSDFDPGHPIYLGSAGTTLTEGKDTPVRVPFEVGTTGARELLCTVYLNVGEKEFERLNRPDLQHLVVDFKGEDGRHYPAEFCFWVSPDFIQKLNADTKQEPAIYGNQDPRCQNPKR